MNIQYLKRQHKISMLLVRLEDSGKETLGRIYVYNGEREVFSCVTLEPSWINNRRNISCIPEGRYKLTPRYTTKRGNHLLVEEVPNRSLILIHSGNFRRDTRGCILVGNRFQNLDNDDLPDIAGSKRTLSKLLKVLPKDPVGLRVIWR